jgi:orotate phosphoribosyltransferase
MLTREPLFQHGTFKLASGRIAPWKIECDALTDHDWQTLALMISEKALFGEAVSVPTGGNKLALALTKYANPNSTHRLVVDDVYTTGGSIRKIMKPGDTGFVVFSRTPDLPADIRALFVMQV